MWPILLHTSSLIKYKRVIIGLILFYVSGFYKQFALCRELNALHDFMIYPKFITDLF